MTFNIIDEEGNALTASIVKVDGEHYWQPQNNTRAEKYPFLKIAGFFHDRMCYNYICNDTILAYKTIKTNYLCTVKESDFDHVEENPLINHWVFVSMSVEDAGSRVEYRFRYRLKH